MKTILVRAQLFSILICVSGFIACRGTTGTTDNDIKNQMGNMITWRNCKIKEVKPAASKIPQSFLKLGILKVGQEVSVKMYREKPVRHEVKIGPYKFATTRGDFIRPGNLASDALDFYIGIQGYHPTELDPHKSGEVFGIIYDGSDRASRIAGPYVTYSRREAYPNANNGVDLDLALLTCDEMATAKPAE